VKVAEEFFSYQGEVARCGGGPSSQAKAASAAEAAATLQNTKTQQDMLNFYKTQQLKIDPFATQRLNEGLPFFNALTDFSKGPIEQAYAPQYAALNRRLSSMGALPSGYRTQAITALDALKARDYDSSIVNNLLMNEQAKQQAAGLLTNQQTGANPLGWAGAVTAGNSAIMQGMPPSPGIGGVLGGAFGALGDMGSAYINQGGKF
jgi:hypothetical protein